MGPENPGQDLPQQDSTQGQQDTSGHPAWSELLTQIPEEVHSQVQPILEKWETGVQDRFTKVHEQYDPYKPFIDAGISPTDIDFALGVVNGMQQDPQKVIKALQAWVDAEGDPSAAAAASQGQNNQTHQQPTQTTDNPEVAQLKGQLEQLAQVVLNSQQQTQQQAEDARLNKELEDAHASHGEFNDNYVVSQMLYRNLSMEDAIKEWQTEIDSATRQKRQPTPPVLGQGGSFPNSQGVPDPTKMNSKDTIAAVANALSLANQQT